MNWLGLDVGGAHLKLASADGAIARSQAFPLWKQPSDLEQAIRDLLAEVPDAPVAATMTGELADCYATKAEGVERIVQAIVGAARGRELGVYSLEGRLLSAADAVRHPLAVAAANWHALAKWAARFASGPTLLIDIGSTTTDLIPIVDGQPAAAGRNDPERLVASELVYTGVSRSPVCAVARTLPWRGAACPVAQEVFATTRDAYLIRGDLPESDDGATADGRPATRAAAHDRLARQICADRTLFDEADAQAATDEIEQAQLARLGIAARNVMSQLPGRRCDTVILSGQGEFLAHRLLVKMRITPQVVSLNEQLGPALSSVAPAYALAVLAAEGLT